MLGFGMRAGWGSTRQTVLTTCGILDRAARRGCLCDGNDISIMSMFAGLSSRTKSILPPLSATTKRTRSGPDEFSELYRKRVSVRHDAICVLLVKVKDDPTAKAWTRALGGQNVHLFQLSTRQVPTSSADSWDLAGVAQSLNELGPIDVIVDMSSPEITDQLATWSALFIHLRSGGLYVLPAKSSWLGYFASMRKDSWRHRTQVDAAAAEMIASIEAGEHINVFSKRFDHYLMLRDDQANRILPTRNPELVVDQLATVPRQSFQSRMQLVSHESTLPLWIPPTKMECPELHLRHYQGKVHVASHLLTYVDSTILPSSFKAPYVRQLWNERIRECGPSFATIPEDARKHERELEGSFYDLNCAIPGHFGHFITESVAKMWGWDEAKRQIPNLKALYRLPHSDFDPVVERAIFSAYGISEDDIEWVSEDVIVNSLVTASQMWHNAYMHFAHPDIRATWRRLQAALVHRDESLPKKIFVSRKHAPENRLCRNLSEVEDYFVEQGFSIFYPEGLTMREQASAFGNARVIAGFGGSAMFNVLFASQLETMILLNSEGYTARNEQLYATIHESNFHYFWSRPDIPHPKNNWSVKAFHSPWRFDFERNSQDLDALLESL